MITANFLSCLNQKLHCKLVNTSPKTVKTVAYVSALEKRGTFETIFSIFKHANLKHA